MTSIIIFTLFSSLFIVSYGFDEWDYLIFTQSWPKTICQNWKEHHGKSCRFPTKKNMWTIHGIWPTKINSYGPEFCNSSMSFNETLIKPIYNELIEFWIDVHNQTDSSLWSHEWEKHGTCAYTLPALQGEYLYFTQGIKWSQNYSIYNALSSANIYPNDITEYKTEDIWMAINQYFNYTPHLACYHDKEISQWHLMEVRLCFNKLLQMIDCSAKIETNCPLNMSIKYIHTNHLNPETEEFYTWNYSFGDLLMFIFKTLILIKWIFFGMF